MTAESTRARLYAGLLEAMRENASRTVMLHYTIAERFGLGGTDIKALDLARAEPELTAGRLAQLTGLSTSSVTALLDRLERRGLIRRERDPRDRRKVIVVATGAHEADGGPVFAQIAERFQAVLDDYPEETLQAFLDLARRLNAMAYDYTATLTRERAGGAATAPQQPKRP